MLSAYETLATDLPSVSKRRALLTQSCRVFSGTAMKIDPNAAAGEIRGLTTAFSDVW